MVMIQMQLTIPEEITTFKNTLEAYRGARVYLGMTFPLAHGTRFRQLRSLILMALRALATFPPLISLC